jgi:hypothetical protein
MPGCLHPVPLGQLVTGVTNRPRNRLHISARIEDEDEEPNAIDASTVTFKGGTR